MTIGTLVARVSQHGQLWTGDLHSPKTTPDVDDKEGGPFLLTLGASTAPFRGGHQVDVLAERPQI